MKAAKELYGTRQGELSFIVGMGPSIEYAVNKLNEPRKDVFRIALNRAIEHVPAEFWFWIDGDAYQKSKDHPNAKAAIRVGVEQFADMYDQDTYIWERALGCKAPCFKKHVHTNLNDELKAGKLVHRATSLIGAISFAMRLGSCRIVTVGCDNSATPDHIEARTKETPGVNWVDVYGFTFARINEAIKERKHWLPKEVMLRDASKIGTEWGKLPLEKTTIGEELVLNHDFHKWLEERKAHNA